MRSQGKKSGHSMTRTLLIDRARALMFSQTHVYPYMCSLSGALIAFLVFPTKNICGQHPPSNIYDNKWLKVLYLLSVIYYMVVNSGINGFLRIQF